MGSEEEYKNPSKLLMGLLDTFDSPTCIIDEKCNILMNESAKEMYETGFDLINFTIKTKCGKPSYYYYQGNKYSIIKKDINHGTKSFICTIEQEDDTISKLKKSSDKLKEVLNVL
jgi:hypothetical protein